MHIIALLHLHVHMLHRHAAKQSFDWKQNEAQSIGQTGVITDTAWSIDAAAAAAQLQA